VSIIAAFDARFMAKAPPERLATVRFLTGAFAVIYFIVRGPVMADFRHAPGVFSSVGIASVLSTPLPAAVPFVIYLLTLAAGVAFTLGARFRFTGPLFALLALWLTSYRNSWGMIFHNDNLLIMHLIVLGCCDAAAALSLDARARGAVAEAPRFGWPLRLISILTALAYVLAGIAKLKGTGLSWVDGEVLRNYIAYDALRKLQIGSFASPLASYLVQVEWPFAALSVLTLSLELIGPVMIWQPRLALVWALGVWGFHVGVLFSMAIAFPYPVSGIAFASLFPCERLWLLGGLGRLRSLLFQPRTS
jgi:hypothetical protein